MIDFRPRPLDFEQRSSFTILPASLYGDVFLLIVCLLLSCDSVMGGAVWSDVNGLLDGGWREIEGRKRRGGDKKIDYYFLFVIK